MSWSYDITQLSMSPKDQVRLLICDTNEDDPFMEDEEIAFYVDQHPDDLVRASLSCLNTIITRITNTPDYKLGPYSESNSTRLNAFKAIKANLEIKVAGYQPPLMMSPTTEPIFGYGIASETCCQGGDSHT